MADKSGQSAQLTIDGRTIDLPMLEGTLGPTVIDLSLIHI